MVRPAGGQGLVATPAISKQISQAFLAHRKRACVLGCSGAELQLLPEGPVRGAGGQEIVCLRAAPRALPACEEDAASVELLYLLRAPEAAHFEEDSAVRIEMSARDPPDL